MAGRKNRFTHYAMVAALLCGAIGLTPLRAGGGVGGSAVGGVFVDVDGVIRNLDAGEAARLLKAREAGLTAAAGDLDKPAKLRKLSLRKLTTAIAEHKKNHPGEPLPAEIAYLAGLQRIQYIFVYPDQNDIVFAGPADGWKLNDRAEVVGKTTGLPVLKLDDLLVALRTAASAQASGIACSIDPTAEGIQRLNKFLPKQKQFNASVKAGIESALGLQNITLTGVPAGTHYARVMVAADYRMKRYAMGLEKSPIEAMPSYLELMQKSTAAVGKDTTPRWWIAPNYQSLLTDGEGFAWELRPGLKVMTEDELRGADGAVQGTGRANPLAKKWADTMTAKFGELAKKDSIFADLQNCIDLSVAATIIIREKLADKAGLDLSPYADAENLAVDVVGAPKHVATEVSYAKKRNEWLITASGGVQFNSWQIASLQDRSAALGDVRRGALADGQLWWWD